MFHAHARYILVNAFARDSLETNFQQTARKRYLHQQILDRYLSLYIALNELKSKQNLLVIGRIDGCGHPVYDFLGMKDNVAASESAVMFGIVSNFFL